MARPVRRNSRWGTVGSCRDGPDGEKASCRETGKATVRWKHKLSIVEQAFQSCRRASQRLIHTKSVRRSNHEGYAINTKTETETVIPSSDHSLLEDRETERQWLAAWAWHSRAQACNLSFPLRFRTRLNISSRCCCRFFLLLVFA